MKPTRRDFLKGAGVLLGSLFLPGCGGGGTDFVATADVPGGYRFVPLIEEGAPLPAGDGFIANFTGIMAIHDDREVLFSAENDSGLIGLYRATFDPNPFASKHLLKVSKVVKQGDMLEDGTTVELISQFVANRHHTVAAILETNDPKETDPALALQSRVYIGPDGGPLQRLTAPLSTVPGGSGLFGSNFFDLDLHEDDDLLLIAHYDSGDVTQHQGLFFLPGASLASGNLLLSTAQFLPDSDGVISGLGLCDLSSDGHYVIQANSQSGVDRRLGTSVISGRTTDPGALRLRSAPDHMVLSRAIRAQSGFAFGESVMGPRINGKGTVAQVLNVEDEKLSLMVGGQQILEASGAVEGAPVTTMWCPVLSQEGLAFLLIDTPEGQKLLASNGSNTTVFLSEGDLIEGRTLNDMAFGTMPKGVDKYGNLVLHGEFLDDSVALVLGIPV